MGIDLAQVSTAFISLLLEGLPFIFLGTLVSGFIDAYLPSGLMDRALPRNTLLAILLSGLLGVIFPVCECAIVPVIGRLIRKGLPISCAITYMLSAPIINPITVVSTLSAFSGSAGAGELSELVDQTQNHPVFVTCSRLLIAYVITVSVGLLIHRVSKESILKPHVLRDLARKDAHVHEHGGVPLVNALRTAMRDCVDTGMYFTIGAGLTAIFNTSTLQRTVENLVGSNVVLAVVLMMSLAFILSLCSTSDAFVAATLKVSLPGLGNPYAAKLGFLVFGPMMDVKLLFMYSSLFRARFVWTLFIGLFLASTVICSLWSLIPV